MSNFFNNKNNSAVLRSFARIASEKKIVDFSDDKINKQASVKEDLTAGENLIENVLKLAKALRSRGNVVQAEELEQKVLAYKAASNALYQVSNETGEDLVDAAHPDGSTKLKDTAGDAVVETITDQHKKIKEVVEKKPTGKLAMIIEEANNIKKKANDLLDPGIQGNRNKYAFGQVIRIPDLLSNGFQLIYQKMSTTTLKSSYGADLSKINKIFERLNENNINVDIINDIISIIKSMIRSVDLFSWSELPFAGIGGMFQHIGDVVDIAKGRFDFKLRNEISNYLNNALSIAKSAMSTLKGENDEHIKREFAKKEEIGASTAVKGELPVDPKIKEVENKISSLRKKINIIKAYLTPNHYEEEDLASGNDAIDKYLKSIEAVEREFSSYSDVDTKLAYSGNVLSKLKKIDDYLETFKKNFQIGG